MNELMIGAVAYDPKVVPIWEGIKDYFRGAAVEMDVVLFTNYEAQVEALLAGVKVLVLSDYGKGALQNHQVLIQAARAKGDQPGFTPVSKGWLKASHREKDPQRSTPARPFYTHTNPQPLTPGEIYEFDIEVLPISYVFKQGHRIRLELANGDSGATDGVFSHPYHPSLMGTDTIFHDGARASCLLLPVIPTG